MKFSVITVCRNSAAVLPRAMSSLAAQTCADYEWIVVDGASTDATAELARGFTAAPAQCISEPDQGIYDAMNKGVAAARGDYVYFLNSDDALADDQVLQRAADAIGSAYEPDLLVGRVVFAGPSGEVLRDYAHLTRHNIVFDSLCHQAVFAHRSLFKRFGGFDLQYRLAADFDWLVRVLRGGGRAHFIAATVARFSTGGAHAQAAASTRAECLRIRRAHTSAFERGWTHALAWLRHKSRRLLGLPARGRQPRGELGRPEAP